MYTVVIPTLNEGENLKRLLPQFHNCEVIICDNGSTDATTEVAKQFGVKLSCGAGSVFDAILRGIRVASFDKIIIMDGDLSHPSSIVPEIAKALDEHDMVIASRYCKGGKSNDSFINRIISRIGNSLVYFLAPNVKDRMSGFFGIRKELTKVKINNGCKPMLEYLVRANPSSSVEIPYVFEPRRSGNSKLGRKAILYKTLLEASRLYLHKYRRFIRFFAHGYRSFREGTLNGLWNLGHKNEDGDFEWWEWYGPHFVKRWWKRKVAYKTRELAGNPERLLVLGCGSSPAINLYHCRRFGIDINKEKVEFLRKHTTAEILVGDITDKLDLYPEEYGCVLCNEVLEHLDVSKVERAISNMRRLLSPDGRAVISIPDYDNKLGRIVETVLHGKLHVPITVSYLKELCEARGLVEVDRRNHLWVTIISFKPK